MDDISLVEWVGLMVSLSDGDLVNFKIMMVVDMVWVEIMMEYIKMIFGFDLCLVFVDLQDIWMGIGYDVYVFEDGDVIIFGGVLILYMQKFKGYFDVDVVLYVIIDVIFGVIGDGDIGQYFLLSDFVWKGVVLDQF